MRSCLSVYYTDSIYVYKQVNKQFYNALFFLPVIAPCLSPEMDATVSIWPLTGLGTVDGPCTSGIHMKISLLMFLSRCTQSVYPLIDTRTCGVFESLVHVYMHVANSVSMQTAMFVCCSLDFLPF